MFFRFLYDQLGLNTFQAGSKVVMASFDFARRASSSLSPRWAERIYSPLS